MPDLVTVLHFIAARLPMIALFTLPLIPFFIAERIWPAGRKPTWRDYWLNIAIALTTTWLSIPLAMLVGTLSGALRAHMPWAPYAVDLSGLAALPLIGPAAWVAAVVIASLFVHDLWFYWAHRLEHRIPFLWEFHKLHHSDELMNSSTWARDHFLQAMWVSIFAAFTTGMIFNLAPMRAGIAGMVASYALILLSMFYHSAIRVRLPWLDRIIVTPQVHRIHHSTERRHYDRNFADALPVFDILFGTYHRPEKDEFPATGLGPDSPAPRSLWGAQAHPVAASFRTLLRRRQPAAIDPVPVAATRDAQA